MEDGKVIDKNCSCKICIKCARNEIDNNIILNNFEINYIYKNKLIKCKCGKEIREIEYKSQIIKILEKEEKEALKIESEQRIFDYLRYYCMICGEHLKKNNNDKNNNNYKYNFIRNKGGVIEHLICQKCNQNLDKNRITIYCIICEKEHSLNNDDKNIDNNNIIANNRNDIININKNGNNKDKCSEENNINMIIRKNPKGNINLNCDEIIEEKEKTNDKLKKIIDNSNKSLDTTIQIDKKVKKAKNKCCFIF